MNTVCPEFFGALLSQILKDFSQLLNIIMELCSEVLFPLQKQNLILSITSHLWLLSMLYIFMLSVFKTVNASSSTKIY